jgi:SAM-dependent methyltransferase
MTSAELWATELAKWSIPEDILAQAETSPWIHPPSLFQIPEEIEFTPSHEAAMFALPELGSVLDIGCGGGVAAFALAKKFPKVIGVDHQEEMLEMFTANAAHRNLESETHLGFWPDVANEVTAADVVTVYNVMYNVSDVLPFIQALNQHARKRVVIEIPAHHPLANLSEAWKHFWNLDRPSEPTPELLVSILADLGIKAQISYWISEVRKEVDFEQQVEFTRIRLCLPTSKAQEIRNFLTSNPPSRTKEVATIWWDIN